jgi:hypothetical protein
MKRSLLTDGAGIPLGRVLTLASCNDSPLLALTLDKLSDLDRFRSRSRSTSTPDTTRTRLATSWHPATCKATSRTRQQRPGPGRAALAHRTQPCLAQQLQPAPALLRAQREGHRRVLRPRRRHHHHPPAHPPGMAPLPLGHPPRQTPLEQPPIRASSKSRQGKRASPLSPKSLTRNWGHTHPQPLGANLTANEWL